MLLDAFSFGGLAGYVDWNSTPSETIRQKGLQRESSTTYQLKDEIF